MTIMFIDLHCHSKFSKDNQLDPMELVLEAIRLGLDGICFTEHHSYSCSDPIDLMEIPKGFFVFRGVEVSTDLGHLLIYGVRSDSWNVWGRYERLRLNEVMHSVHSLGGICIPAHPFRGWESLGTAVYDFESLDAIETHNGVNGAIQNNKAMEAARKLKLTSTGGSDSHLVEQAGRAFTEFQNPVRTIDELVVEIKQGRCRGLYGPVPDKVLMR